MITVLGVVVVGFVGVFFSIFSSYPVGHYSTVECTTYLYYTVGVKPFIANLTGREGEEQENKLLTKSVVQHTDPQGGKPEQRTNLSEQMGKRTWVPRWRPILHDICLDRANAIIIIILFLQKEGVGVKQKL